MKHGNLNSLSIIDLNRKTSLSAYIRKQLALYLNLEEVKFSNIAFVNGADAAIHLIVWAFLRGKRISYADLNYNYATRLLLKVGSRVNQFHTTWTLERGYRELASLKEGNEIDVVYITNPDNKFGLDLRKKEIKEFIKKYPDKIFIMDESYRDYFPKNSIANYALKNNNILIIRSFSKFFGLEAYRIGYILGNSKIITKIKQSIPQYPISTPSITSLLSKIKKINSQHLNEKRAYIKQKKKYLYSTLDSLGLKYSKSQTNFVTVEINHQKIPKELDTIIGKKKIFKLDGKIYCRLTLKEKV